MNEIETKTPMFRIGDIVRDDFRENPMEEGVVDMLTTSLVEMVHVAYQHSGTWYSHDGRFNALLRPSLRLVFRPEPEPEPVKPKFDPGNLSIEHTAEGGARICYVADPDSPKDDYILISFDAQGVCRTVGFIGSETPFELDAGGRVVVHEG